MGDWRQMGSSARRRMGAPSYHGGGAAPAPYEGISGQNKEKEQAFSAKEAARTETRCKECGFAH